MKKNKKKKQAKNKPSASVSSIDVGKSTWADGSTVKDTATEKASSSSSNAATAAIGRIERIFDKSYLLVYMLLVIGIGVFVFRDFLFQKFVYLFTDIGSDSLNIYLPQWILLERLKAQGEALSSWSFCVGMGEPLGIGRNELLSFILNLPFNLTQLPFKILAPLNEWNVLPYSIVYTQFSNIILIGIFFLLYLRTMGVSKYAAVVGGLLFAFSGYVVIGSCWYHTPLGVNLVFLLFAFEQWFCKKRWYFLPYAFFLLSGYIYYLHGLFLGIYAVFRFIDSRREFKTFLPFTLKLIGMVILGVLLDAATELKTFQQIIHSPRGEGMFGATKVSAGTASYSSSLSAFPVFGFESALHNVTVVMRLLSNDLLGNGTQFRGWRNYLETPTFYCGLISVMVFPQVFTFLNNRRKLVFGGFLLLWVIPITFPYFRYSYYLFTGDYYKQAFSHFIPIVLIFFTTTTLHHLIKERKRINPYLLGGTLAVWLVALYYPYFPKVNNLIDKDLQGVVRNFLLVYTVLLLLLNNMKIRSYVQIILLLTVVFELGYFSNLTINKREAVPAEEFTQKKGFNDYSIEAIEYLRSIDDGFYRVEKTYSSSTAMHASLNDAQAQGYFGTRSYSSFNQIYYIRFLQETEIIKKGDEVLTRWAPGVRDSPVLHGFAAVKYMLAKEDKVGSLENAYEPIHRIEDVQILKNKFEIPFGFTYDSYVTYEQFTKLSAMQKRSVLLKACVVENEDQENFSHMEKFDSTALPTAYTWNEHGNDVEKLRNETFTIEEHRNSYAYMKGSIAVSEGKVLFFSIPYDKGWHAKVDGKTVPVHVANIGFLGFVLEPGQHEIELEYIVKYQTETNVISTVSLAVYILLIILGFRKPKEAGELGAGSGELGERSSGQRSDVSGQLSGVRGQ